MTNFIIVLADDETYGHMDFMPFTKDMNKQGRVFTGCRLDAALCQPQRMGLYSGLLARDHLTYNNALADIANVDTNNTIAKWLHDVGYRTGLIGKWTNAQVGNEPVPTGWTTWKKFKSGGEGPAVGANVWDGTTVTTTTIFQLDYIYNQFATFISGTEPWFVVLCPEMPHVPYAPSVTDLFKYRNFQYTIPNETNVSDKPAWIQAFTQMTATEKRVLRYQYRQSLREVAGVEAMMKRIYNVMDPSDTTLFYVSDNGFNFGEHNRRVSDADPFPKYDCYDTSLHVPLIAYGKDFTAGITTQPTQIQDITKTIVTMAGATASYTLAGKDLRDVQNNPSTYSSRNLLHQTRGTRCPDSDCITTTTRKLTRYYGDTNVNVFPNGNVSSSAVTVTGAPSVYESLNDTSDAEYVTGNASSAAEFIVDLADATDPNYVNSLAHFVIFRAAKAGTANVTLTVQLRQGTTVLTTWTETLSSATPTTFTELLAASEADSITDYTTLRLRFLQNNAANTNMRIYYAYMTVPQRSYEAYDLDTDPNELSNWAANGARLAERNTLETALNVLVA